nr:hypothetical protein C25A11.2 - Caenorhabditis elegans [Caenorhabditis elegans]
MADDPHVLAFLARVHQGRRDRVEDHLHEHFIRERNLHQRPQFPPLQLVPVQAEHEYEHPFPLVDVFKFSLQGDSVKTASSSWQGLQWKVKCSIYNLPGELLATRVSVDFFNLMDRVFKATVKYEMNEKFAAANEFAEVVIDSNHSTIVFPETGAFAPGRLVDGMLPTEIAVKIKLEHAEIVDQFSYNNQSWVMGTRWVRYGDECSVRMNFDVLKNLNPCHDKFFDDLREQVLSPKEARAFFDFASAIFNRSFMGLDLFHESQPSELTSISNRETAGMCQIFKLNLDPSDVTTRFQVASMNNVKSHTSQFTFYLENSPNGYLLIAGGCFQMESRQLVNLKLTLFDSGVSCRNIQTFRILHKEQSTIKVVIALLDDDKMEKMSRGKLLLNFQMHMNGTISNVVRNFEDQTKRIGDFAMPGLVTGYINCRDKKRIGVCKEHLANNSEHLNMLFFNTVFEDCGKNEITVNEDSDIVLDALDIIYHRSLAIFPAQINRVLDLAGYWLSATMHRFMEIAILHSTHISDSAKLELAAEHHFDIIKYVARHPRYASTYHLSLTDEEIMQVRIPADNEVDGGTGGRPRRVEDLMDLEEQQE